jgi:hypothetical protein
MISKACVSFASILNLRKKDLIFVFWRFVLGEFTVERKSCISYSYKTFKRRK